MFQDLINEALETGRPYIKEGEVATYIPELGRADKNKLGISIFCRDGSRFSCGDTKDRFSIQSISKVISLAVALEVCGFDMVFENVGMEPSGDAFNSLIKLEGSNSHPYNPMINSGAIAVASFIEPKVSFGEMLELARCFCQDDGIVLDEKVYRSEMSTVARNRAIAYLLESKGVINGNVEEALDFYVKMCSLSVTAESLAGLGLLLANDGVDPSGKRLFEVCGFVLDNKGAVGDAAVMLDGLPEKIGPTSTACGAALVNAIVIEAVGRILESGEVPPVFLSANLDGGDEHNKRIFEEHRGQIFYN